MALDRSSLHGAANCPGMALLQLPGYIRERQIRAAQAEDHRHGNSGKENRDDTISTREPIVAQPTDSAHAGGAALTIPVSNDQPHNAPAQAGHRPQPVPKDGQRHRHGC